MMELRYRSLYLPHFGQLSAVTVRQVVDVNVETTDDDQSDQYLQDISCAVGKAHNSADPGALSVRVEDFKLRIGWHLIIHEHQRHIVEETNSSMIRQQRWITPCVPAFFDPLRKQAIRSGLKASSCQVSACIHLRSAFFIANPLKWQPTGDSRSQR
jgi:hypothetical protein